MTDVLIEYQLIVRRYSKYYFGTRAKINAGTNEFVIISGVLIAGRG